MMTKLKLAEVELPLSPLALRPAVFRTVVLSERNSSLFVRFETRIWAISRVGASIGRPRPFTDLRTTRRCFAWPLPVKFPQFVFTLRYGLTLPSWRPGMKIVFIPSLAKLRQHRNALLCVG
jgi:hypothetical protein